MLFPDVMTRFDDGSVVLDLWLGCNELLPQLYAPADGLADVWYLDGFAPSKIRYVDSDLFAHLYRLSRPLATLSTFTAAGFVRRANGCWFCHEKSGRSRPKSAAY